MQLVYYKISCNSVITNDANYLFYIILIIKSNKIKSMDHFFSSSSSSCRSRFTFVTINKTNNKVVKLIKYKLICFKLT